MNRPVAIIVALVVIVGAGAAAYVKFGDRGPVTENAAAPAETATPPATPPAATTTESTAGATTAPATTTESTTAATTAPATTTETPAAAPPETSSSASTSAPTAPSTGSSSSTTAPTTSSPTPPAQTAMVTPPAPVQPVITPEDHVLGSADAPVTIVEYASMTCPHCAAFHAESMPKLKSEFIDKNQVRLVFRPFPLDRLALRASLMAECVPGDGYFALLDKLFATQREWIQAEDPLGALRALGKEAGIEESKVDGCMTDEKAMDRIAVNYKDAVDAHGVNSTPSFIINGTKFAGALPFDDLTTGATPVKGLSTIIRELLPK